MSKKLITLLLGLFIPFVNATSGFLLAGESPATQRYHIAQPKQTHNSNKLSLIKNDPILKHAKSQNAPLLDFGSVGATKESQTISTDTDSVLPDLFNLPVGVEPFIIQGNLIKSVDLKERNEIDGANLNFIFRR